MNIPDLLEQFHSFTHGEVCGKLSYLVTNLWSIFESVNGSPNTSNGVSFFLMLFFAFFTLYLIQTRARILYDRKCFVALIGIVFLIIRIMSLIVFEWGWEIKLYDDWAVHALSPPLEHFWYIGFFYCMSYYTLVKFDYYPGILKNVTYYIPPFIIAFFVYTSIYWKNCVIYTLPAAMKYTNCLADIQTHVLLLIMCLYVLIVTIVKYKKYHKFICMFWGMVVIRNIIIIVTLNQGWCNTEIMTIVNALSIWSVPVLALHFVDAYTPRLEEPKERRKRSVMTPIAHKTQYHNLKG